MSTPRAPPPSHLLVAGILQMVVRNAIARAVGKPIPCSSTSLNRLRTQLLQDDFFDPASEPEQLTLQTRPSRILLGDIIVLLAKLVRVLIRQSPLTEAEQEDRVVVRNEVLTQPFFDRLRPASQNPFAEDPFDDEGCFT